MKLGVIGDDFTGSSDVANTLAKQGMSVVLHSGTPTQHIETEAEACVIALKSRSADRDIAIELSLEALNWLKSQGCQQILFKYCSTFDSTNDGNIGPVADALAEALDADNVIFCPAFPGTGRSIYQGHLFVNDKLLNESGMEDHPLTPMTDADIRRWLQAQTKFSVGHISEAFVSNGHKAIEEALRAQKLKSNRHIVVDAINDADLIEIGKAAKDLPLITGGSGIALGLPANFGCDTGSVSWHGQKGKVAVLSGSCSNMTRAQITQHKQNGHPSYEIDVRRVIEGNETAADIANWVLSQKGIPLAYSSADPEDVLKIQEQYGRDKVAVSLETLFADIALLLVSQGINRLICAGGETSGAIVEGLKLEELAVGPEIAPGVPALRAGSNLVIALKSGNFGDEDFFEKANEVLQG